MKDVDRVLYPHHVGHYLGLDVHDTHDVDRSKILRKGMVVTIGMIDLHLSKNDNDINHSFVYFFRCSFTSFAVEKTTEK